MGVFVELSNKLTLGEKVLQTADLVLALPNPGGLRHQHAGAWLLECPCQAGLSRNHRMGQDRRDHRGASGPSSLLSRVVLDDMALGCVQTVLQCLQRGRLCTLSGQSVPVSFTR